MAGHFTWVLLWFGVALILAHQTAKDANRRGHDGNAWAAVVLLTGLLGVAVYLLSRNDRVLHPEERPPRTSISLFPIVYLVAATVGTISFGYFVYSTVGEGPIALFAAFLGFAIPPAVIYKMRKSGRRRRAHTPQPPNGD